VFNNKTPDLQRLTQVCKPLTMEGKLFMIVKVGDNKENLSEKFNRSPKSYFTLSMGREII